MIPTEITYLGLPGTLLFALVLLAALAMFVYTASRRWQLMTLGGPPESRWDNIPERIKGVLEFGILQRKMFRDPYAGLYHILIFGGFCILGLRTVSLVLEGLFPKAGMPFLPDALWHPYLLLKDIILITTLAGVILALGRRYLFRKERLDPSFDAAFILCLIGFLMITDLGAGAAKFVLHPDDPLKAWEPVTAALSTVLAGSSESTLKAVYNWCWWLHLIAVFAFGNYLPFAKHFHVITALPNIFLRKLVPGKLSTIDIEKAAELEKFGVSKLEDFTWKQKLDIFTCTECGRCREVCPTHLTGKPLTPKGFMVDLRKALYTEGDDIVETLTQRGDEETAKRMENRRPLVGGWIHEETVWACTTCRYCEFACPVGITYTDKLIDMRRSLVLEKSEFPKEAQTAFNGMERQGNPWNLSAADRDAWTQELPFSVTTMAEVDDKSQVEYLFWVGCAGSYEDRGKKVSRALATLLNEAGIKFAILGAEETCNGDSARRLGNEYLFQMLAQQNIETMNNYGVKKIVTNCPHCFNTLKNEYPDLGGKYEVVHGTELVSHLVKAGKIKFQNSIDKTVTFHDPCYLGRHNEVYEAPRAVLRAIPGLKLHELGRSKETGMCCGAGGGRMWLDEKIGARINQTRYAEIEAAKTDGVGVSCPFCMVMLGNASTEMAGKTEPFDVLEFAAKSLPQQKAESAS